MNLDLSLKKPQLVEYVVRQLQAFFPDGNNVRPNLERVFDNALERTRVCFSMMKLKAYCDNGTVKFNHLFGDQYCVFLYFLSREAFLQKEEDLYVRLSLLNKTLFGIDLFGHVEMPDHFLLVHPVGSVVGRAKMNDFLVIYQHVTIGGIHRENIIEYPELGTGCVLFSNSSLLGSAKLGNFVSLGANSSVLSKNVPSNTTVLGQYPQNVIKPTSSPAITRFFNI